MTPRVSWIRSIGCGLIILACQAPQTPTPTLNAALVQTCAPFDGQAVALFLTERPAVATYPEPPYWAITVYRSITNILGRSFEVGPETQSLGQGQVCPSGGECHPASAASVSFGGFNPDSTVDVTYRVVVTPDSVVSGRARARFQPASSMCG